VERKKLPSCCRKKSFLHRKENFLCQCGKISSFYIGVNFPRNLEIKGIVFVKMRNYGNFSRGKCFAYLSGARPPPLKISSVLQGDGRLYLVAKAVNRWLSNTLIFD